MCDLGSLMKEQLTDGWTRRLETTKDAEVSRAGKAREILYLQAWRGKEREQFTALPRHEEIVCVYVCTLALQNTDASLFFLSSLPMFTVGQFQSEAQDQGSPLIWCIEIM